MSSMFFGNLHDVPYNSLPSVMQMREASVMTNVASTLQASGDLEAAEQRHQQALLAKQQFPGANTTTAAISHDNLGRVQLQMGKLDEAEANFRKAIDIRRGMAHNSWDNCVTRENLAQTLEAKGDLKGAKEARLFCGDDNVCCAHYECPNVFERLTKPLKHCSTCKCVFYCSASCQKADWKKRHKNFCHAPSE